MTLVESVDVDFELHSHCGHILRRPMLRPMSTLLHLLDQEVD